MRPGLVASWGGLLITVALGALGAEPTRPLKAHEGRGFVIGASLGPGRMSFGSDEPLALVIGESIGTIDLRGGGTLDAREGQLVPLAMVPADLKAMVVPLPSRQNEFAVSVEIGWSASRRLAILADFDLGGGWSDSFTHLTGAAVVRYSPVRWLWLQGGPAGGDISYGFGKNGVVQDIAGGGGGFKVAAGIVVLQKRKLQLDLEVRSVTLWFDQLRATNMSAQMGVRRRR